MRTRYIVEHRNTFLALLDPAALNVCEYMRIRAGEPSIAEKCKWSMTRFEVSIFEQMETENKTESRDIVAGRTSTYKIVRGTAL